MMDFEVLKVFISAFGGAGVAYFAAWALFKSYKGANDRVHETQNLRITALEAAVKECNEDRKKLHDEMAAIYRGVVEKCTTAFTENSEALGRLSRTIERTSGPIN